MTTAQEPLKDLADAFVKVWFQDEADGKSLADEGESTFHKQWAKNASADYSAPELFGANALRTIYPNHSLVMTQDPRLNPIDFPGAYSLPINDNHLTTNVFFIPLARRLGAAQGVLIDGVEFGSFKVAWDTYDFIVYIAKWQAGFGSKTQIFVLHHGPEKPIRDLLVTAGVWQNQLHDEIWVFNRGFWSKDHSLWVEIQKADWKDVILKEEFKGALQKDIYGFFDSQAIYKELAIPWKRGVILHGPPGNGKTISLKTIMKTCDAKGFTPLYVKSFQSFMGEEASMELVFNHARQLSPCVIVLEDLDSLINNQNRSFFLNQLDGLDSNDGLLVMGTTNHFDRLDPGLSTRPSRFDRKYLFDDPVRDERVLYAQYWQDKLKSNDAISFPDSLVSEVADLTDKFSFAYLKEAFVSSLVLLAGYEDADKPDFASILKNTIKTLREQLDKNPNTNYLPPSLGSHVPPPSCELRVQSQTATGSSVIRPLLDTSTSTGRTFVVHNPEDTAGLEASQSFRFRHLLNNLSVRRGTSSERIYSIQAPSTAASAPVMPGSMPPVNGTPVPRK